MKVSLSEVVGGGYNDYWRYTGLYRVCKGSRSSKKSKTTALNFITRLCQYPDANLLVIRKTFRTLKDSCFAELRWAMNRLGVSHMFSCTLSPLEITHTKTGQKIYFRGLDDPLKVTSITVERGFLCWLWVEEAYEVTREDDFDMIDEAIRGKVPDGLFKQATLTFNPWSDRSWLKSRFFDNPDENTFAKTTNYLCNEWLDNADRAKFDRMKTQNPRRYQVAGLGDWGITDGLIFENWREEEFELDEIKRLVGIQSVFGLDFGYTNDPSALFCGMLDKSAKKLYVFDEMYEHGMSNERIFERVQQMGYVKERIYADSSEPKSIDRLELLGLPNIRKARKGRDSVQNGIDFLQDYELIIRPKCVNFITEISTYCWSEDKFGHKLNKPIDGYNHLMDAMRYAVERYILQSAICFD